jgi:hypothetical protein
MDKEAEKSLLVGPTPFAIVPNQNRKMETLFQHWLTLSETQKFVHKELDSIDQDLGLEYQQTVLKGIKSLVEQISDMSVELSEQRIRVTADSSEVNLVPPRSPRRRRPSGSGTT